VEISFISAVSRAVDFSAEGAWLKSSSRRCNGLSSDDMNLESFRRGWTFHG
jgi:hypothetical protein